MLKGSLSSQRKKIYLSKCKCILLIDRHSRFRRVKVRYLIKSLFNRQLDTGRLSYSIHLSMTKNNPSTHTMKNGFFALKNNFKIS